MFGMVQAIIKILNKESSQHADFINDKNIYIIQISGFLFVVYFFIFHTRVSLKKAMYRSSTNQLRCNSSGSWFCHSFSVLLCLLYDNRYQG